MVLIPLSKLRFFKDFEPHGILHIGAHQGEEARAYKHFTSAPIIWIEAQQDLALKLSHEVSLPDSVLNKTVSDQDGQVIELMITNNSQSTSVLSLGTHKYDYPDVEVVRIERVETSRVDSIFKDKILPNFVNIDIQGAEMQALKGFGARMSEVDVLYIEVNYKAVYKEGALVREIDQYLKKFGLKRVLTFWVLTKGWGDAIYVNKRISGSRILFWAKEAPNFVLEYTSQTIQIAINKIKTMSRTQNRKETN